MLSYSLTCLMLARSSRRGGATTTSTAPQFDREPHADRVRQLGEDCGRTKKGDFLKLKTVQLWGSGHVHQTGQAHVLRSSRNARPLSSPLTPKSAATCI